MRRQMSVSYHLEESEISNDDVVEVDLWIDPGEVEMRHLQADSFVMDQGHVDQSTV